MKVPLLVNDDSDNALFDRKHHTASRTVQIGSTLYVLLSVAAAIGVLLVL